MFIKKILQRMAQRFQLLERPSPCFRATSLLSFAGRERQFQSGTCKCKRNWLPTTRTWQLLTLQLCPWPGARPGPGCRAEQFFLPSPFPLDTGKLFRAKDLGCQVVWKIEMINCCWNRLERLLESSYSQLIARSSKLENQNTFFN